MSNFRLHAVQKAAELVQKYKTRDPFAMADASFSSLPYSKSRAWISSPNLV